jgi:hypothetical protein
LSKHRIRAYIELYEGVRVSFEALPTQTEVAYRPIAPAVTGAKRPWSDDGVVELEPSKVGHLAADLDLLSAYYQTESAYQTFSVQFHRTYRGVDRGKG